MKCVHIAGSGRNVRVEAHGRPEKTLEKIDDARCRLRLRLRLWAGGAEVAGEGGQPAINGRSRARSRCWLPLWGGWREHDGCYSAALLAFDQPVNQASADGMYVL